MRFLPARALALVAIVLVPAAVSAQSIGTLSWQLQPFCNRLTLAIDQAGSTYSLKGFDDQCGVDPGRRAPATGTAVLNPDGTVELGVAIVTAPSGRAVHVDARVSPATGQGTWSDDAGNGGTFAIGASTGGPERREPTGAPAPGSFIDVSGAELPGPYGFGVIVNSPTATGAAILAQWGEQPAVPVIIAAAIKGVSGSGVGVVGVSTTSVGVTGISSTGTGVGGQSAFGPGVFGISEHGPAVRALALGDGPALELSGALAVSGPVRPAFQHQATIANINGHLTTLDHPLLNGHPTALVFVTHVYGPGSGFNLTATVGVYYDQVASRWTIFRDDGGPMPVGVAFNVLVVNQ